MTKTQTVRRANRKSTTSGSFGGVMDMARERPIAAAAAAAGAAAAGVFLWSKRAQISDQLSQLSDQVGEWTDSMSERASAKLETLGSDASRTATSAPTRRTRATTSGRRPNAGNGSALHASTNESPVA
ncbi:MAG: hypothetical protein ABIT68_08400 [Sphingomicrobium sp.]